MTEDVVLIGPAGPPIVGHDAVRDALFVPARWRQDVEETVTDVSVEVLGRTAIVVRSISATASLTTRARLSPGNYDDRAAQSVCFVAKWTAGSSRGGWNLMEKAQEEQRR